MINKNAQKKKEIEAILAKYIIKMFILKQKRDSIVLKFLEALKEKRLDEIRQLLKQL